MAHDFPRVTVDGCPIPPAAFAFEFARLVRFYARHLPEEQLRRQLPLLRERAVEQAIGARLLIAEAERLGIDVPAEDVDSRLAAMAGEAGGAESFAALLARQRLDEASLRAQMLRGRRVDLLVERITSGVPEPAEEEMRAHFEAHREEYSRPERALAQHILIKPADDSAAAREAARARLEAIRRRVRAGASFADEAAAHSDCPSGKKGGSLGWIARGTMLAAFDNALFAMGVHETSPVLETPLGLHLLHKAAHEEAAPAEYDEARESVREFLRHARRGEALARHVAELRRQARIEVLPPPPAAGTAPGAD